MQRRFPRHEAARCPKASPIWHSTLAARLSRSPVCAALGQCAAVAPRGSVRVDSTLVGQSALARGLGWPPAGICARPAAPLLSLPHATRPLSAVLSRVPLCRLDACVTANLAAHFHSRLNPPAIYAPACLSRSPPVNQPLLC